MKKAVFVLAAIICVFALTFAVTDAKGVADAVYSGISSSLTVIIPSLFALMVISTFILESGVYLLLFRPLYFLFGRVFRMDFDIFSVFLLSLFGGYPVGIKLLKKIAGASSEKRKAAESVLPFCYCGSPSFITVVVGIGLYGSAEIGLLIYTSNALSCIIFALITSHWRAKPNGFIGKPRLNVSSECLVSAVMSSSRAMLAISSAVVFFYVLIYILNRCLAEGLGEFYEIISAFMEISNVKRLTSDFPVPLSAALTSLGGICILFQTAALSGGTLPLKRFMLFRIPIAALSFAICQAFVQFIGTVIPVSAHSGFTASGNVVSSLSLVVMTVMLLLALPYTGKINLKIFFQKLLTNKK